MFQCIKLNMILRSALYVQFTMSPMIPLTTQMYPDWEVVYPSLSRLNR